MREEGSSSVMVVRRGESWMNMGVVLGLVLGIGAGEGEDE